MLAELAAANAAFAIIKEAVSNGKDLLSAGAAISDFVNAKEDLRKNGEKRKKSPFASNDLEEFLALEKIREQEEQLREIMIWSGRAGLWNDWQKFQAEARKERIRQQEEALRKRQERIELIQLIIAGIVVLIGIACLVWWGIWLRGY
jgi:hypothetical protein